MYAISTLNELTSKALNHGYHNIGSLCVASACLPWLKHPYPKQYRWQSKEKKISCFCLCCGCPKEVWLIPLVPQSQFKDLHSVLGYVLGIDMCPLLPTGPLLVLSLLWGVVGVRLKVRQLPWARTTGLEELERWVSTSVWCVPVLTGGLSCNSCLCSYNRVVNIGLRRCESCL